MTKWIILIGLVFMFVGVWMVIEAVSSSSILLMFVGAVSTGFAIGTIIIAYDEYHRD